MFLSMNLENSPLIPKISAAKEPKHMPGQNKKAGLQNCKPAFGGLEEIR